MLAFALACATTSTPAPIDPLARRHADPAALGVDPGAFIALVDRAVDTRTDALVVLVDGDELVHWPPSPKPIETMSMTKSVVGLAVAWQVQHGLMSPEASASTWIPELDPAITVDHLVRNTTGLAAPPTNEVYQEPDFVAFGAGLETKAAPGEVWAYNNATYNLVPAVLARSTDQPIDELLAAGLFGTLGIEETRWSRDGSGNCHGMSGLSMTADDLAKLGQLLLDGTWGGAEVLAPTTLELLAEPTPGADTYGFGWWRIVGDDGELEGLRADGYLGQSLVVLFEPRLVAVRQMAWYPGADERDHFLDFHEAVQALVP